VTVDAREAAGDLLGVSGVHLHVVTPSTTDVITFFMS